MTALFAWRTEAERIWHETPLLMRAYPDVLSFVEHFRIALCKDEDRALQWLDEVATGDAQETLHARLRQGFADKPCSTPAADIPLASRIGSRLLLWAYGPVGHYAPTLREALEKHRDAELVVVRFDSAGGDIDKAFSLAGAIESHRGRSVAMVDRACLSAAVIAAVSCDRILIRSDATMLIHQSRGIGYGTHEDHTERARSLQQTDRRILRHLAAKRRGDWRELLTEEKFLDADTAVRLGLADCVIGPLPPLPAHLGNTTNP